MQAGGANVTEGAKFIMNKTLQSFANKQERYCRKLTP